MYVMYVAASVTITANGLNSSHSTGGPGISQLKIPLRPRMTCHA